MLHSSTTKIAPEGSDGHEEVPSGTPDCYTTLRSFDTWFRGGGLPVLMYHKLGPRPPGVRLRGLYVGLGLFRRQLSELAASGYQTAHPAEFLTRAGDGTRRIALTFDDGFENVLRHGLEPLRERGFQAIQFLVSGRLGGWNEWEMEQGEVAERLMDATQVREWMAAGHAIGAHTRTHPRLTQISPDDAREEIRSSRGMLEDLFGVPVRHFCYPYGDWNPAIRDAVLEAGFETACTTQPGLNRPTGDLRRLRRLTARHATRRWRNLGTLIHVVLAAMRHS